MDIEEAKKDLKKMLSEERYIHSLGVMKMARELALIYGENAEKAEFAGLIHDIAKEFSKEEIMEYVTKHNIEMDEIEKRTLGLMHGKIGASIAKEKYGADEEMQNAIKYHTTGNVNMDRFAKIIYLADKVEENRNYEGVEERRKEAKTDMDKSILTTIDYVIQKSINTRRLIHPDTIDLRNRILENEYTET